MSLHPAHLTDSRDTLLPAALIPFCSYQGSMLGKEVDGFVACDQFQPTVLEGQRCYSLYLSKVEGVNRSMTGKKGGLTLVLDPNTVRNDMFARIYLHTLSPFTDYWNSSYAMSVLKKMSGTRGFLNTADGGKICQIEEYDKCNTREYLGMVSDKCQCTIWALEHGNSQQVVVIVEVYTYIFQDLPYCTPASSTCISSIPKRFSNCRVSCTGLYADVSEQDKMSAGIIEITEGRF